MTVEKVQKERLETFRNMKRDRVGLVVHTITKWMFATKEPTLDTKDAVTIMLSRSPRRRNAFPPEWHEMTKETVILIVPNLTQL